MVLARSFPVAFDLLSHDADHLLDRMLNGLTPSSGRHGFPAMNAWQDGERFVIEAELPGMKLADVEITVNERTLTLKGKLDTSAAPGRAGLVTERFAGEFSRTITLPTALDASRAEAELKDGILTISLPSAEHAKVRRIPVKPA